MPTFSKLLGGLGMTITAVIGCYLFLVINPTVRAGSEFYVVSGLIGFLVGWRSIGFDPGFGGLGSIVSGIRGSILLVLISALIFGLWAVIGKLEAFLIKDIFTLIEQWFDLSFGFFLKLGDPTLIMFFIFGGCISGIIAGLANRFWT